MTSEQACEFPVLYNDNYLILLVRDPKCIFAYWEITDEKRREVKTNRGLDLENSNLTLRVYDLTGVNSLKDAHGYFNLDVHPLADNYFIKQVHARRSYCAELGIRSEGSFHSVICSNIVQTPADSFSDGSEIVFKNILPCPREKMVLKIGSFSTHGIYGSIPKVKD